MKGKIRLLGLVMVLGLVVAVLVISVSGWAQKGKPQPPAPPADPAIAYTAWHGGSTAGDHKDVMVVNADGSNKRAVVTSKNIHYNWPDWSPDGKWLVFRDGGINICKVDGTGLTKIVPTIVGGPVAWSPVPLGDGQYKIAYADNELLPDGTFRDDNDLFLVNIDGTQIQRLTNTPGYNESPFTGYCNITWSPDGQYLAAAAYDDIILYRIDFDGNKFTATSLGGILIPGSVGIEIMEIDWANTQNKLVVCGSWYELLIIDVFNPSNIVQLTHTPNIYEQGPSWSPDDSQIVFVQLGRGIWVMNSDGSGVHQIVPAERRVPFERPQWRRNIFPQ